MRIFANQNCAECGQTIQHRTGMKLRDGNYICATCKEVLPECIRSAATRRYGLGDFKKVKAWMEKANKDVIIDEKA